MLATVGKGQFLSEYLVKNRREILFLLKSSQKPFLSLCMKKAIANSLKIRKGKIKNLSSSSEVMNMIHMERTIKCQMLSVCQILKQIHIDKCVYRQSWLPVYLVYPHVFVFGFLLYSSKCSVPGGFFGVSHERRIHHSQVPWEGKLQSRVW